MSYSPQQETSSQQATHKKLIKITSSRNYTTINKNIATTSSAPRTTTVQEVYIQKNT